MKRLRHNAILELIRSEEISSQEELMRGLKEQKIEVSQSTLSRDIQELRLAKTGGGPPPSHSFIYAHGVGMVPPHPATRFN